MSSNLLFSVIVPSHNGADRISTALKSVLQQTFQNYELIVVCDSCTDNTEEIARTFGAKTICVDYQRDGLSRNAGLDEAKGDWILFLDDDDWYLHEYVFELLAEQVGKNNEDMFGFSFIWKDDGYKKQSVELLYRMTWCYCWRREFIGEHRFADIQYGSDSAFHAEMINRNPTIAFWDMPIYYYNYMREGSLSWQKQKGMIGLE